MNTYKRIGAVVVLALVLVLVSSSIAAAQSYVFLPQITVSSTDSVFVSAASNDDPEKETQYYVSLGNSLAAGYQPDKKTGVGSVTDDAYTDQIYQRIKGHIKNVEHKKLGCPGETSVTFISGGLCPYPNGISQLAEAILFLQANAGKIAFITIDIGGNDIVECVLNDPNNPNCIPGAFVEIAQNLASSLLQLKAVAPGVPIIGLNYYNPTLASWLEPGGLVGEAIAEASNEVILDLDDVVLGPVYDLFGVPVADITAAFDTGDFTLQGGVPHNVRTICRLTWMCDDPPVGPDIHPNKNGYKVIARTVEQLMKSLGII